MSAAGFIQYFKLCRLSQPAHERALYRVVGAHKVRRLVEIGVAAGDRAENLISVALRYYAANEVRYAGIDLFEAREDALAVPLKEVHRRLIASGANVRLVPGNASTALQRAANDLRGTDCVVIAGDQDKSTVDAAWHFLPRMLHQKSKVWIESPEKDGFTVLTARDVSEQLVLRSKRRRAA